MNLKPENPTPGYPAAAEKDVVSFQKVRDADWACMHNGINLGHIHAEVDGFHYFHPLNRAGYWPAVVLRQIAAKIDELDHGSRFHPRRIKP